VARAPKLGSRSPWGKVDNVETILPGDMWFVSTPSHGGIKLSRRYQGRVPEMMRRRGAWYEEDVDWSIPGVIFADAFSPKDAESAASTMKNWLPDEYRELTGIEVAAGESHRMRERQAKARHRNDWVAVAAFGDWHEDVPPGKVGVVATVGGRRDSGYPERYFLVDENRYKTGPIGYVIDEAKDIEVSRIG
jgi:hypothetical protein